MDTPTPEAPPGDSIGYSPPPHQPLIWGLLGTVALLVVGATSVRLAQNPDAPRAANVLRALPADGEVTLADEPEMDDEYEGCADCHDDEETNFTVRAMDDEHDEMEFKHGTTWCFDCHEAENRDYLHLAGGKRVDFDETSTLCGQCHGGKVEDWETGVHGKRTGHWNGDKEYRPCISCHNPHVPGFEPIKPEPAPKRPGLDGAEVVEHEPADEAEGAGHE
jgi:hypothetical protein